MSGIIQIIAAYGANAFAFETVVASNVNSYDVANSAYVAGWDGVRPINAKITIQPSIFLSSNTVYGYALDTGSLPSGSIINLINNGVIVGAAGQGAFGPSAESFTVAQAGQAGGHAIIARAGCTLLITNNGTIAGGGGGGGATPVGFNGTYYRYGGSGGNGQSAGNWAIGPGYGTYGDQYAGSPSGPVYYGGAPLGGNGGYAGSNGQPGGSWSPVFSGGFYNNNAGPGAGGGGGACAVGSSYINWIVQGTRYGALL